MNEYISASFWGFADVVKSLVESGCGVNYQNEGTLWTPLHAATLQEHGKVWVCVRACIHMHMCVPVLLQCYDDSSHIY